MLKLHSFYRKFDSTPKENRFIPIEGAPVPTSLFVIFQQLTQVRAQQRYFKDREAELLSLAEKGFLQLEEGKGKEKEEEKD